MDNIIGGLSNFRVDTVLSAVDKYVPGAQNKFKNLADKAKAYVNNLSDLEMKVMEATNHEPWGPHGTVMQEITNSSFNSEGFYQIMGICDQRLSEGPDNWRLVYKTLLLLEYMCKHGPLSVAEALSSYSRLSHLEKLRDRFEYKDPAGRDQGINVRQRAGALVTLVQDRDKLKEERDKAVKNKSKYTGVSSSTMSYGGFSSSSSSYDTSSYSNRDFGSSTTTSTSYQRSSSSGASGHSSGFGSSSTTTAAAAAAADPVEATRQRIARLKAEGVLNAESAGDSNDGVGPGLESPTAKKQHKKLSEIRIDPAISAAFAKGGLAPPPGSTKSASAGGSGTGAAAGSSGIDLLGDLDVPAPAAPAAGGSAADEWDGFAGSSAAAAAGGGAPADEDWSAFDSAPSTAPAGKPGVQKGPIDINALLGPLPTTASPAAAVSGSAAAPLPLGDFSMPPTAAVAAAAMRPAQQPAAADPFGPFVAPTAASKPVVAAVPVSNSSSSFSRDPFAAVSSKDPFAGSSFTSAPSGTTAAAAGGGVGGAGDPFAASGVVHMVPQASKQHSSASSGPKVGPETAKAKDPFADLAFI